MNEIPSSPPSASELLAQILGTLSDEDRLQEIVMAYAPILEEIAKLRTLDLTDIHPAVIFEPTAAYRKPL